MSADWLAVFDLGKTNAKLLTISAATGEIAAEERTAPRQRLVDGIRLLDHEALWSWLNLALERAMTARNITGLMFTTHGCCFAMIEGERLAAGIIDYEQAVPEDIDRAFRAEAPPFSETFSPDLPAGLNFARHIFWREIMDPAQMRRTDAILGYPQYWAWRFSGARASEVSYFGCHSHLWRPLEHDFSSLAYKRGWHKKFPAFRRAGGIVGEARIAGRSIAIHNGVHDSNAALYYYRSLGLKSFTLISTGTWVIIFNSDCPLQALDPARDMLANVTVDGAPIATARFMGGREYDIISKMTRAPASPDTLQRVIDRGQFALPSFAPGGAFPHARGRFAGPPAETGEELAAIATLYVAAMTTTVLSLIESRNDIIVDGGLANNAALLGVLAALRPSQNVVRTSVAEGTAFGAAALAFEAQDRRGIFRPRIDKVAPLQLAGLEGYIADWMNLSAHG